ncbi:MAG: endonuclease MutS2 [Bacteroidales bacterium]
MIYPTGFEQKAGFEEIKRLVARQCLSQAGRERALNMAFSSSFDEIAQQLKLTAELMEILKTEASFPAADYFDLSDEIIRLRPEGTFFDPVLLGDFRASVISIQRLLAFFSKEEAARYPELRRMSQSIRVEPAILQLLNKILDERGEIRDDASEELLNIRREIVRMESRVARRIEEILKEAKKEKITSVEAEITVRNGRLVIPIPAVGKRRLRGFIHDASATGQTLFVEPDEVFDMNNDIAELRIREKQEIIRILTGLADRLRPHTNELLEAYSYLTTIDFLRAKAEFSLSIHAIVPQLSNEPIISWYQAVHPLLWLLHKAQGKEVVPQDIHLDATHRILIISGPNAGGKSVTLRTVALLQYMLQCGLPIPVKDGSVAGIFEGIMMDIGDEQSIENDLSTYSSHLLAMRHFMEKARPEILFLVDEMGSGTEPRAGGAIAEAVIEKLSASGALGIITTHYANLKLLQGKVDGIVNGAMLFDLRTMKPLYKLQTGRPGSSFAFEIASQMGLPSEVIRSAEKKAGQQQVSFDQQLQQLEIEKEELEKKRRELELADELLTTALKKYQELYNKLEVNRKEILRKAREEASDLLRQTNRLIERTIAEIKKAQAEKEATQRLRQQLQEKRKEFEKEKEELKPETIRLVKEPTPTEEEKPHRPLTPGDTVRIKNIDTVGELVSIDGEEAVVLFNNVKLTTRLSELEPAGRQRKASGSRRSSLAADIQQKLDSFRLTIDLRGLRGEDALRRVDHFLDEAVLLNIREIRILHGKGNGILRTLVRQHLGEVSSVASYRDESPDAGGDGITVVSLK